jgi:hypothetical protein
LGNVQKTRGKLFVLLSIVVPVHSFAHGNGASFESEVSGYKVDIGYDPSKIEALENERFDFELYDSKEEEVKFDYVWVNISLGDKTIYAGGIHNAEIGGAGMTMVFPEGGDYVLSVRYQKADKSLAETKIPFSVSSVATGEKKDSSNNSFLLIFLALVLGAVIGFVLKKKFE